MFLNCAVLENKVSGLVTCDPPALFVTAMIKRVVIPPQ